MPAKHHEILISARRIQARVRELAAEIDAVYAGKHLTIIIISNGAIIFGADLVRKVSIPLHLDTISVSSYIGNRSTGNVNMLSSLKLDISDHSVLVVDDIIDTGQTLHFILDELREMAPASLKTCVLLDKNIGLKRHVVPDFVGFKIHDQFVIGYGLDYNESYRNLPHIALFDQG
jgi:hypoxanthine phosphoribosyltransferase